MTKKKTQLKVDETSPDQPKVLCCVIARTSIGDCIDRDDILREVILPGMWTEMLLSDFHRLQSAVGYANAKSSYYDPKYQVLAKAREEDVATILSDYNKFTESQQKKREQEELKWLKAAEARKATAVERKRKQLEKLQRELGETSEPRT